MNNEQTLQPVEMGKLSESDLSICVGLIPDRLRTFLELHPQLVVAGGFIRSVLMGEAIHDIDVFCTTPGDTFPLAKEYAWDNRLISTTNAFTIRERGTPVVQFIHRWSYETPDAILKSFDFTIAGAAIWFASGWKSLTVPHYRDHLALRRLVYKSPIRDEDSFGSLLRVLKFYQKGYVISPESFAAVVARAVIDRALVGSPTEKDMAEGLLNRIFATGRSSGLLAYPRSELGGGS